MNSYLKFLSGNQTYTAIESIGLSVSLAFVILIGSYVQQQYGISRQSPDCDRIHTLGTPEILSLSWWDKASLEDNIPEVETAARVTSVEEESATFGDRPFLAKVTSLDKEFFDMFPEHKVPKGSLQDFDTPDGVPVSESFAAGISKEKEGGIITNPEFEDYGRNPEMAFKTGAKTPSEEQALTDKLSELSCAKRIGLGGSVPGALNMSVGIKKGDGEQTQLPLIICDTAFFDMLEPIVVNDFGRPRKGGLGLGRTAFNTFEASDTSTFFNNNFEINGAACEFLAGEIEDIPTESWHSIRNYALMALASCALGAPAAVYSAGKYLERFSYSINGIWWIIAAACLTSLTISIASVLWQTLRAARTNPSDELKKD